VKSSAEKPGALVAQTNFGQAASIARLSTLYGPGQSFGKQQGLLAHIARCILRNRPFKSTYRSTRFAITSRPMMPQLQSSPCRAQQETSSGALTKIIASEQPTTIAEIISIFRRIARRAPRIVTEREQLTGIYSRRVAVPIHRCAQSSAVTANESLHRYLAGHGC